MKTTVITFLLLLFFQGLFAQSDSSNDGSVCRLRISLLTCSPGDELYSTWGHSAIRVFDSATQKDLVYNYGTFDFEDPAFYSKFTNGKLLYFVSVENLDSFLEEYRFFKRGVAEQVLNLSCEEKNKLALAMAENAKEKNKYYKYDFLVDNCTTRLRNIVFRNAAGDVSTKNISEGKPVTFRNLIHKYLDSSHQKWSKLGIDILLGQPLDHAITNEQAMFLPDNLLKAFDSTVVSGRPLVFSKKNILPADPIKGNNAFISPLLFFTILFLLVTFLTATVRATVALSIFDFFLFFFTGALGLFLLFLWFATDHPECRNNFNIIWAFPLHFFISFFLFQKRRWIKYYFLVITSLLMLLIVCWTWLPQQFNIGLLPLVCTLLVRSLARYKNPRYAG